MRHLYFGNYLLHIKIERLETNFFHYYNTMLIFSHYSIIAICFLFVFYDSFFFFFFSTIHIYYVKKISKYIYFVQIGYCITLN